MEETQVTRIAATRSMKSIMFHLCFLISGLAYVAVCALAGNVQSSESGYALIAGKPVSVKLSRSISDELGNGGEILMGDMYRVKLKNIRSVHGDFLGKQSVFELMAAHKESILSGHEIYVLLEIGSAGEPRVLHWTQAESVVCFPPELIKGKKMEDDFKILDGYTKRLCTHSEWFR